MLLVLIIVLVVALFGSGWGGYSGAWPHGYYMGGGLGLVLLILVILLLLGRL